MKCPVCVDPTLTMADRQGIEIDYCPQCRGVWLDRGELDKILERSVAESAPAPAPAPAAPAPMPTAQPRYEEPRRGYEQPRYDDRYDRGYDPRKKRKKNMIEELFDF